MRRAKLINLFGIFAAGGILSAGIYAQKLNTRILPGAALSTTRESSLQAPRRPEGLCFDPATRVVTIKTPVQEPNGNFIPNIRRDNFAVYENGALQRNADVEIEHAPVTLAVLTEWGGRYRALTSALGDAVPRAARQFFDEIGRNDKVAVFRYADHVDRIADFSAPQDTMKLLFIGSGAPDFSELNFYDALISTIDSMKTVGGRKAIVLISSGIDTFSKAKYADALASARDGGIPIYVIGIGPALRASMEHWSTKSGPYARIDWNQAEKQLQEIAKSSGGRLYPVESTFDLSGIYDDLMENLRVRYVITYTSKASDRNAPRTVRVELVDPATGGPLEIIDANGKAIRSKLAFESSYIPSNISLAGLNVPAKGK